MRLGAVLVIAGVSVGGLACRREAAPRPAPPPPPPPALARPELGTAPELRFVDVAAASGVGFVHDSGARGDFFMAETNSGGGGFWDPDGDGDPDLLLLSGAPVTPDGQPASTVHLYVNDGKGGFTAGTREAGLLATKDAQAFAVSDVDGDGSEDLVVGGLRHLTLWLNDGTGRFRDATAERGLGGFDAFANALAFMHADDDALADLVVGGYVVWSEALERKADCRRTDGRRTYCPPKVFPPDRVRIRLNKGAAFAAAAGSDGASKAPAKALGLLPLDHDADGDADLFVANDGIANLLLERRAEGGFADEALLRGLVMLDGLKAPSGMGVDAADLAGDGRLCVAVGNFSKEPLSLHCQARDAAGVPSPGVYQEVSVPAGVGGPTRRWVTFGVRFADLDLDGRAELLVANGHVEAVEDLTGISEAQPAQAFSYLGERGGMPRFADATPLGGLGGRPVVGRGLATADIDGDGDLDVLVVVNDGAPMLLRNDTARRGRPLRIRLRGRRPGDRGMGAWVTLRAPGGRTWRVAVRSGGSYGGESERVVTVGIPTGEAGPAEAEVHWPGGLTERFVIARGAARALLVRGRGRP